MNLRKITLLATFFAAATLLINFGISPLAFRSFEIILPEEVAVYPGEEVEIRGGILNTGLYSLHWFNLTLLGLPEDFEYSIQPNYWEHLMILREWNPKIGIYRVPENFTIRIKVPSNVSGLFLINVTGQEHLSWKKVSNSSFTILRVLPLANFTITNISIPEEVKEYEQFNVSMIVTNIGETSGMVNVSIEVPSGWNVSKKSEMISLGPNESKELVFEILPTNTSGEIKIVAEYPYRREIIKLEKVGPYLIPKPREIVELPEFRITGLQLLIESIKALPAYVKGIAIILVIIIVYNIFSIIKARKEKKRPEEMKKKKGEAEI